jgi:hypothetical protein
MCSSPCCILPNRLIHLLIDSTGLKVFGVGEWLQEKHGANVRHTWKKQANGNNVR